MKYSSLYTLNGHRLRLAVDACIDREYAFVHQVLFPETASALMQFCDALPFGDCRSTNVWQKYQQCGYLGRDWPEEIHWLATHTEEVVGERARARALHGLMSWRVNDISVQKYDGPETGIDWHRDYASDKHLVVIYTVSGKAQIELEDIEGSKRSLTTLPGSVFLLTGPNPMTGDDPRMRHRVGPPLTDVPRISIALRMHVTDDE